MKDTWQEVTTVKFKIKRRVIKKMQADSRVGRQKALQILTGEDESPRSDAKWIRKEENIQPVGNRKKLLFKWPVIIHKEIKIE